VRLTLPETADAGVESVKGMTYFGSIYPSAGVTEKGRAMLSTALPKTKISKPE
jgi:hypothetical protein